MDYRIFNMRTWSFLCVRIHTGGGGGGGHTNSESAQDFLTRGKKSHKCSCAPDGVWTLGRRLLSLVLYQLKHPVSLTGSVQPVRASVHFRYTACAFVTVRAQENQEYWSVLRKGGLFINGTAKYGYANSRMKCRKQLRYLKQICHLSSVELSQKQKRGFTFKYGHCAKLQFANYAFFLFFCTYGHIYLCLFLHY